MKHIYIYMNIVYIDIHEYIVYITYEYIYIHKLIILYTDTVYSPYPGLIVRRKRK